MMPLFPRPGVGGALLSIFLVMQIVPYFITGFESVAKGSEEAREGFDPRNFTKAIYAALTAGFLFYVIIIAVVTYVYPWQEIVSGHVRTEVAFERTFGSHRIAQLVLFAAFLSSAEDFQRQLRRRHENALRPRQARASSIPSLGCDSPGLRHAVRRRSASSPCCPRHRRDAGRRHPGAGHRRRVAHGRDRLAVGLRRIHPRQRGVAERIGRARVDRRDRSRRRSF